MLALCIEASHERGLGHLFRAAVLARALVDAGHAIKFYVNDQRAAINLLTSRGLPFDVVPLIDGGTDWETAAIVRDGIRVWINDRHRTDRRSTARVKAQNLPLVTFDDRGDGAADADLHIAALAFDPEENLAGRRVLRGIEYLLLDPSIKKHRRLRVNAQKCIVTLGGADTYGVTPKIVRALARAGRGATVIVGPAFQHDAELAAAMTPDFVLKRSVPSLIEEFSVHDIAVTGGGMTPFEANATGLPCIVVANEDFEIPVGRALADFGGAVFAGHYSVVDETLLVRDLPVETMSRTALDRFAVNGTDWVVEAILSL